MTRIDLKSDIAIANVAAAIVMVTGAINWALPLGKYLSVLLTLTLAANVLILPILLVKHRAPGPMTAGTMPPRTWAMVIGGAAVAYALVRSLFGITAAPWALGTMASHAVLVPLAIGVVYFALLAGIMLTLDFIAGKSQRAV